MNDAQEQQFNTLYSQYNTAIYRLCLGYCGEAALAQDLLQETFVKVWNNMSRFRGESAWGTWIYRIAVNTCLMARRGQKQTMVSADHIQLAIPAEADHSKEQQVNQLYTCISRLAETDRLIISMVLEEKPYDEIAAVTGFTENNVRVKIHRIKKQLTEMYNTL